MPGLPAKKKTDNTEATGFGMGAKAARKRHIDEKNGCMKEGENGRTKEE